MSFIDWTHVTAAGVQTTLLNGLKQLEPTVAASSNTVDDALLKAAEYTIGNPLFTIPLQAFLNTIKAWALTTGLGATADEMQGAEFLAAFEQECHRLRDEAT